MAVTSTKSDSAIDICNRGLIFIGAEPITSFDDGTTEASVAANVYEDVVQSSLCNARWRFATNQQTLNRLTDAPTARYDLAYQQPNDTLIIHAITVRKNAVAKEIPNDKPFNPSIRLKAWDTPVVANIVNNRAKGDIKKS